MATVDDRCEVEPGGHGPLGSRPAAVHQQPLLTCNHGHRRPTALRIRDRGAAPQHQDIDHTRSLAARSYSPLTPTPAGPSEIAGTARHQCVPPCTFPSGRSVKDQVTPDRQPSAGAGHDIPGSALPDLALQGQAAPAEPAPAAGRAPAGARPSAIVIPHAYRGDNGVTDGGLRPQRDEARRVDRSTAAPKMSPHRPMPTGRLQTCAGLWPDELDRRDQLLHQRTAVVVGPVHAHRVANPVAIPIAEDVLKWAPSPWRMFASASGVLGGHSNTVISWPATARVPAGIPA